MQDWEYAASATPVKLTQGSELSDLGNLGEYVHAARKLLQGEDWELVSHDLWTLGDQPVLTLIFRRPQQG